jgi:glutathione S-transferase
MRLYVLPGACSLASHIALQAVADARPAGSFAWDVVVLERGRNHDPAYTAVNPLGTVPALVAPDGRVIVESLAVLLHIAEAAPEVALAPPPGNADRDRVLSLLSAMVTAGHTAFQMLWRTERFADTPEARASVQRMCEQRLGSLFERLEAEVGDAGYLAGSRLSVADLYLFVLCRWGLRLAQPTTRYPRLWAFTERLAALPAAQRAMAREGIALHGPKSGLG